MGASTINRATTAALFILVASVIVGCGREGLWRDPNAAFLTLVVDGTGAIEGPNGLRCEDSCTFGFPRGTVVSLTAVPNGEAELAGWWTDCSGTDTTCEVEMDHDRLARARFGFRTLVEASGSGTGRVVSDPPGIDCPSDCSEVFVHGTDVELTAIPESGSSVHSMDGALCTGSPCSFTASKPQTVSTLFYGGAPLWARSFGGSSGVDDVTSNDHGYAVGIGVSGQIHLAGAFRNTVDFGNGQTLTSSGGSDLYLVTLDQDGNATTALRGGDVGDDALLGLTMVAGDIYVAGYITDPTFGDLDSTVQRVTPDGQTWTATVATGGDDFAIGLASTGSEVAVAGQIGSSTSSNEDALVTGYARAGGAEANRAAYGNDTATDVGYYAASDSEGNVIVVGQYTGEATFGGADLSAGGGLDGFIAKYNPSRSFLWSIPIAGAGDDVVYAVGTDGMNVIVAGTFAGTVDFGGQNRTSVGSNDLFVARYDTDGNLEWVETAGSAGDDEAFALAVDTDGSVVVTGYVSGAIDFGDGPLQHHGGTDLLVARFDRDGSHQWSYTHGGPGDDMGFAVKLRADGQPVVAGSYRDSATIGASELKSAGGTDILVLRSGR